MQRCHALAEQDHPASGRFEFGPFDLLRFEPRHAGGRPRRIVVAAALTQPRVQRSDHDVVEATRREMRQKLRAAKPGVGAHQPHADLRRQMIQGVIEESRGVVERF